MYKPETIFTKVALNTIISKVKTDSVDNLLKETEPKQLEKPAACFVSIHMIDGSLRGCIGTIEPTESSLYKEIIRNAVAACTRDSRFSPVKKEELEEIIISVDVLTIPEEIENIKELDPSIYGVIVSDRGFRKAVLLPGLKGIDSVEEQLKIVKRKAGIYEKDFSELTIKRFSSTRYH
jgi:uncharacterized protein